MGQRLKNTLTCNLAPGASVVLPHGLATSVDRPLAPDIIFIPDPSLAVTASNTTSITVENTGSLAISGAILVESWHTIERSFNNMSQEDLPIKPYVVVSNGSATGLPIIQTLTGSGCLNPDTTIARFSTETEEPLVYLAPLASGADGRQVTLRITSGTLDAISLPDNLGEGIDGPPGTTYTISPLQGFVVFEADIANNTWWKVAP